MKKFVAILLVLVIGLFAFTACNKDDDTVGGDYGDYKPVEKFDGDKLKETWTSGEITFANKNKILLPCTIDEFMDASELRIPDESVYANKQLKSGESINIALVGEETRLEVSCENLGDAECGYRDATVVGFNFFNSANGNRAITVAAGLTVGITRAEVEEALGIPEGKTSEDRLYTYKVELENNEAIRMSVSFNSSGVVNSISYDLDK